MDFNLSSKSSFPGPPGDIECGIVRPAKTVMGDFLVDAEALLVPAFVLYIDRFQIKPEERTLSALFGGEYVAYQEKVRRWL